MMVQFQDLPPELIHQLFHHLDVRSVLRCRELSTVFKTVIDGDAALQYKIELALDGMEDGPSSALSASERLNMLRKHRHAWKKLRYTSFEDIPMHAGGVWELYGGVLAQGTSPRGLAFTQLPSKLRGIEQKTWALDDVGVKIRDFGMDPAQDLLVIVVKPPRDSSEFTVHLRCLSTGKPHPGARIPAILTHVTNGRNFTFTIQTSGPYLGVLFQSSDESDNELVVWNWQTGTTNMILSINTQCPFAFLSERHVLVTYVRGIDEEEPELVLGVFDFLSSPEEKMSWKDMKYVCELLFPPLTESAEVLAVMLRSDPAPGWQPDRNLTVPFYKARDERLFVLTSWFAAGDQIRPLLLFFLSSSVLSHVERIESGDCSKGSRIPWEEWGPSGSRLFPAPINHSPVWVCYVHGTSFICSTEARRRDQPRKLQILDFNQLGLKKVLTGHGDEDDEEADVITSALDSGPLGFGVFAGLVSTSLRYQRRVIEIPGRVNSIGACMVSDDSIIMVYSSEDVRQYRVLNF